MGARYEDAPERYAEASPAERLPLGVPTLLVHGDRDLVVPVSMSERYAARARAAGDDVTLEVIAGEDHMAPVDPASGAWAACVERGWRRPAAWRRGLSCDRDVLDDELRAAHLRQAVDEPVDQRAQQQQDLAQDLVDLLAQLVRARARPARRPSAPSRRRRRAAPRVPRLRRAADRSRRRAADVAPRAAACAASGGASARSRRAPARARPRPRRPAARRRGASPRGARAGR